MLCGVQHGNHLGTTPCEGHCCLNMSTCDWLMSRDDCNCSSENSDKSRLLPTIPGGGTDALCYLAKGWGFLNCHRTRGFSTGFVYLFTSMCCVYYNHGWSFVEASIYVRFYFISWSMLIWCTYLSLFNCLLNSRVKHLGVSLLRVPLFFLGGGGGEGRNTKMDHHFPKRETPRWIPAGPPRGQPHSEPDDGSAAGQRELRLVGSEAHAGQPRTQPECAEVS